MNVNEVIESYVADVALQLPRRQRNDVAYELRALIDEGLQDKAEASGREVDAAMAVEFLRAFGRPADVAARYRPELTIIDPADGRSFLRAALIGVAVIWALGLLQAIQDATETGHVLGEIGQWLAGTVVGSLWWPGVLVAGYGMSAWSRRRRPQASDWKPRSGELAPGSRSSVVMGILGIAAGLFVLFDPRWVLDFFWNGHAAPAAYNALTYTDTFRQRQGPWIFVLLALYIPLYIALVMRGRWSVALRRVEDAVGLALCMVFVWTLLDGPVFMAVASDRAFKFFLLLSIVYVLLSFGIGWYRRVRPTPN